MTRELKRITTIGIGRAGSEVTAARKMGLLPTTLAVLLASLTACASQHVTPLDQPSSTATNAAPERNACTMVNLDTWSCNPKAFNVGTVLLMGDQKISMLKGGSTGQYFTLRVMQDSRGGRVPTWDKVFLFQNSTSDSANPLVPLSFPDAAENVLFQYDGALSKWVYLSRSGIQQIAPTIQGSGTNIGGHPGRASSTQALYLPANTETGVFGDNGGFFGPEGNGVVGYYEIQAGVIQFCNYDEITTLATFHCNSTGDWPTALAHTAPAQVRAGACTEFQVQMVAGGNPALKVFTSHVCYINPGNSVAAYATWNSVYNEEIPYR